MFKFFFYESNFCILWKKWIERCGQEKSIAYLNFREFNPLNANPEKWSNTLKQIVGKLPTICLSVFDHFMNLAFKWLTHNLYIYIRFNGKWVIIQNTSYSRNSVLFNNIDHSGPVKDKTMQVNYSSIQLIFTCSKLTTVTLEKVVKYVQR